MSIKKKLFGAGAVALSLAIAAPASAITVNAAFNYKDKFSRGDTVAYLNCGGMCLGWDGNGWSATDALFFKAKKKEKAKKELKSLNGELGTNLTLTDFGAGNRGVGSQFTVDALYTFVRTKIGWAVFQNLGPDVDYIWQSEFGKKTEVKRTNEIGTLPSAVPVPASLPLLLAGLGGLALLRRRKSVNA